MRRVSFLFVVLVIFLGYGCAALKLEPPTVESKYFRENNYPCYEVKFDTNYYYEKEISFFAKNSYMKGYMFTHYPGKLIVMRGELTRPGYWVPKSFGEQVYEDTIIYESKADKSSGVLYVGKLAGERRLILMSGGNILGGYFASIMKIYNIDEYLQQDRSSAELANYVKKNPKMFNIDKKKQLVDFYIKNIRRVKCPDKEK